MNASAALRAGARMALSRVRGRSALLILLAALLASAIVGLLERRVSPSGAADRALAGVFRVILPLTAFSLSQLALGSKNLRDAVWPAARFGMHRGLVGVGQILGGAAAAALGCLGAALVALLVARAGSGELSGEMPLLKDLLTTAWIAPLVALAYAAWFGLGATFGKLGGGRAIVLIADFIVGATGAFGAILPRGSAYNLIGLGAPLDISQQGASGVLVLMTAGCLALVTLRCRS